MVEKTSKNDSISFGRASQNLSQLDSYMYKSGFDKDYKSALCDKFPVSDDNNEKNFSSLTAFMTAYRHSIVDASKEVLSAKATQMPAQTKEKIKQLIKKNNTAQTIRKPSFKQTADNILTLKLRPVIRAQLARIEYNVYSEIHRPK